LKGGAPTVRNAPPTATRKGGDPTMPHVLAKKIARRVLDGEYAAGHNLREIPLAEEFGVGRSSVREALRILERDGVVVIEPRRGASVTRLTTDELIEIYQIRGVLLGLAMAMFCTRHGAADQKWIEARFLEMESVAARDGHEGGAHHAELSTDMARYIIERSGNERLHSLLMQVSLQIARYTRVGLSAPERRAGSRDNWREVVAAMARRDSSAAEAMGRKLVADTLRFALAQLV